MRNICSLFFYELLNVIKVTNQILGKSISSRVKVGCSKVKRVCWLCCNSWQSWTGESHVSTFSFHRTLRHWASFCNDWGGLRRAHEGRITAWRHQPGWVSTVKVKVSAPGSPDGQWRARWWLLALGTVSIWQGAFQQQWGMTMDTLIAHVLRRGNLGWNKSFWLLYWSCIWNPEASSCKVGQTIASKISVKFVVQSWQSIRVTESSFLWPVSSVSQYLYSV